MMNSRAWAYPVLVGIFVAIIATTLRYGEERFANEARETAPVVQSTTAVTAAPDASIWDHWTTNATHPLSRLILQIVVIVILARLFGVGARYLGQPAVIGEIAAGIALGPSLLGAWFPQVTAQLFPASSLGVLQLLSHIGVILFMFVVGLDLDVKAVRTKAHAAVAVSHVSILLPFLLGVLIAFPLYRDHAPAGVTFQAFALFMGIAMSITAFPVLARILDDRALTKTTIGSTALTCAAVDDVTAWTLLAFVVAVVTAGGAWLILGTTLGLAILFALVMIVLVRPLLGVALAPRVGREDFTKERLALVVGVMLLAALTTEVIGVHALFGAFFAGAVMPADEDFRRGLRERLESVSAVFLLPLFFAFTGLRTEIGLMNDGWAWLMCLAIIALATFGKFAGSTLTARLMGLDWNSSFILGALMDTRGLMELIALNVGYDLGVITPEMFTVLVLMALVTTALTGPVVDYAVAYRHRHAPLGASTSSATDF